MYLSHLSLTNFRNIRELELDLPPNPIVLVGANAQGKTSILESIYLLAVARSFRTENDREVINWEAVDETAHAMVAGIVERKAGRERVTVGYQCVPSERAGQAGQVGQGRDAAFSVRKQATVGRVRRRASELIGLVNAVLFNANDLQLVYGAPSGRRRYLDILLSQANPAYLRSLQRYQRVIQQRNQLLRMLQDRRAGDDELAFWNEELVKEGANILTHRLRALVSLKEFAASTHAELSDDRPLSLVYKSTLPADDIDWQGGSDQEQQHAAMQERFAAALQSSRAREIATGSTVVGPHRDDLRLLAGEVDMGTYASRGQARTVALALRLAEASYLSKLRGDGPIVLLDDVLSELDGRRRAQVLRRASSYEQVLITTTDLEPLGEEFLRSATCFQVAAGQVTPLQR